MPGIDERLTRELRRLEPPADPTGAYERVVAKRERRRILRKAQAGALAFVVIAGTVAGVYGLSRVFRADEGTLPAVSPWPIIPRENGRIAITTGDAIRTVDPAGSDAVAIPIPGPGLAWHVAWSPDGKRLAVVMFDDRERTLYVMGADGSNPSRIASAENVSAPSWWPDGTRIAYVAESGGRSSIHVVNSDGSEDRVLHGIDAQGTRAIFSAKVSPDGTQILFDQGTDVGFDIFAMAADGSDVRQLTHTGQDYNPSWSPDGTEISFTRQEGPMESDIFTMAADGSDVRRLTDDGEGRTNLDPNWSPDGTMIAYIAGRTGGPGPVVVMNADGTNPTTLVSDDVLGVSWQPLPPSLSPSPSTEAGRDIGLGFPVCFAERLGRIDYLGDGTDGNAWTAVHVKDDGTCPRYPAPDRYLLAVDHTGDRVADSWIDLPFECSAYCPPHDATDLDGNGTEELIVVNSFSIMAYYVFDVRPSPNGDLQVEPILVAAPGHEPAGIFAGEPLAIDAGGDEGYGMTIECEGYPSAPVIVWSWSHSPVDGNEPTEVHVTRIELQPDGLFHVIDTNDFTVPAGTPSGIANAYELGPQCGVDWFR